MIEALSQPTATLEQQQQQQQHLLL